MSRKFKNFYELRTVASDKGEKQIAVYKGGYYRFAVDDRSRSVFALKVFAAGIIVMVLFIIAGMTNGGYSRNLFIVLPFVVQFMPVMLILISSFPLIRQKGDLTVPQYKTRFIRIRTMSAINIFLCAVMISEAVVFAVAGAVMPVADDLIFAGCVVLMGSLHVMILFLHRSIGRDIQFLDII